MVENEGLENCSGCHFTSLYMVGFRGRGSWRLMGCGGGPDGCRGKLYPLDPCGVVYLFKFLNTRSKKMRFGYTWMFQLCNSSVFFWVFLFGIL